MGYVYKETEDMFNIFSDMYDVDYYIRVVDPSKLEQAMEIAEREYEKYCDLDSLSEDEYDYYYNVGYCSVVTNELDKAKIIYKVFTELKEDY